MTMLCGSSGSFQAVGTADFRTGKDGKVTSAVNSAGREVHPGRLPSEDGNRPS